MTNVSQKTIFNNALILSFTEVAANGLSFILLMATARTLGPNIMGAYSFGLALVTIFRILVSFGFEPYIQREVGKNPAYGNDIFLNLLVLRTLLFLFSLAAIMLIGYFAIDDLGKREILFLCTAIMFFQTNFTAINAFFRSHHKSKYEGISRLALRLINTLGGLLILWLGFGVVGLLNVELVAQAITSILVMVIYIKKIGMPSRVKVSVQALVDLVADSWKFFLIRFVQTMYNMVDLVIISYMVGDLYTGYYASVVKLISAFSFIPSALSGAFLSALSRDIKESLASFLKNFHPYLKYQLLVGAILFTGVSGFAYQWTPLLFGKEFLPAITSMKIMGFALFMTFFNWPLSNAIIAFNREGKILRIYTLCASLNIALNFFLIPIFKDVGSSISTVVSQVALAAAQWAILPEIRKNGDIYSTSVKITAISLFIFGLLWALERMHVPFGIGIAVYIIVWPVLLFGTKIVTQVETQKLIRFFKRK